MIKFVLLLLSIVQNGVPRSRLRDAVLFTKYLHTIFCKNVSNVRKLVYNYSV